MLRRSLARSVGPSGDDGEGITYWAEKAKKRMTARRRARERGSEGGAPYSQTRRKVAGPGGTDGRTDARMPAEKLMMLSKLRHFSVDGDGERERDAQTKVIRSWITPLSVLVDRVCCLCSK